MSKAKLKKELAGMTKEQVINIMLQLYDGSKEAKKWLEFFMEPDVKGELEKAKKELDKQFTGWKDPSFRECNKIVSAFSKMVTDPAAIIDLMLYYVEQGCELTANFGDYEESFYTALENNFIKALKFIDRYNAMQEYIPRIRKMIKSVECCGYGFPDTLWDYFYEYGGSDDEE